MRKYKSLDIVKINKLVKKIWIFTSIIIVLIIFILFLPWQQTIKGVGQVIAYNPSERNYFILAPISGYVEQYYVEEDQFVKKGEPLLKITVLDKKYLERLFKMKKTIEIQIKNVEDELLVLKNKKKNIENNLKIGVKIYKNKIDQIENKIKSLKLKKIPRVRN